LGCVLAGRWPALEGCFCFGNRCSIVANCFYSLRSLRYLVNPPLNGIVGFTFLNYSFAGSMEARSPQLNLVVLRSSDLEEAVRFYREMGLVFTRHAHGSGPEHYASEVNGTVFEIYPLSAKSSPTTGTRIGFNVESVDGAVTRLSKIGATVMTPPTDSEWGRRAVVKDFDGHTVELVTPKPAE
jgi:predicted enzyme related to lactoylglutathione lyase